MCYAYQDLQSSFNTVDQSYEIIEPNITREEEEIEKKTIEEMLSEDVNLQEKIWQVEIPKIGLTAPIAQGTSQEVMSKYVGHFENTKFWEGNIGLAAHNRRISNKLF